MKVFLDKEVGKTLYESHKNRSSKGMKAPKMSHFVIDTYDLLSWMINWA